VQCNRFRIFAVRTHDISFQSGAALLRRFPALVLLLFVVTFCLCFMQLSTIVVFGGRAARFNVLGFCLCWFVSTGNRFKEDLRLSWHSNLEDLSHHACSKGLNW
jgi:hypothetical protein